MSYLYQHATLGGLMAGLMEGTEKINKLLDYGDFGIGTFDSSDGELIILDGKIYHADEAGEIAELAGEETTPYAAVTNFISEQSLAIQESQDDHQIKTDILNRISPNIFAGVKITGTFEHIHVRVAPKQTKPYPKFVEIARLQPEFEADKISGTIVGFFSPDLFHGASVEGFHLHFISEDHSFGGHVLDFTLAEGLVEIMEIDELRQHFPKNREYLTKEIDLAAVSKDIAEAE